MLSQKEVCDERVAEAQKKLEKLKQAPVVSQVSQYFPSDRRQRDGFSNTA